MQAERDHLVRFVFPRVRAELLKRRLHFIDVDLRWGVTSEQDAFDVCMEEIDHCRPRFLCILGQRFGWIPLPRSVDLDDMQAIDSQATNDERNTIHKLYTLDHQRSVYKLSDPDRGQVTASEWQHDSSVALRTFQRADLPASRRSITASEVMYGALDHPDTTMFRLFYFRDRNSTDSIPAEYAAVYREKSGSSEEQALGELKNKIRNSGVPVYEYSCHWDEHSNRLIGFQEFGQRVYNDLIATVNAEFGTTPSGIPDPFEDDNSAMEAFVQSKIEHYVTGNRLSILEELKHHAFNGGYFCITGEAGTGKSAFLAKLYQEILKESSSSNVPLLIIPHFIGASGGSTNIRLILRRWCHELAATSGFTEQLPQEYPQLHVLFPSLLASLATNTRVLILLDAVNQMDEAYQAHTLKWLPDELPSNVTIILSTTEGSMLETVCARLNPRVLRLPPLDPSAAAELIRNFTQRYRKTLDAEQFSTLLNKTGSSSPLYVRTALEELRTLGRYEEITQRIAELPSDTTDLFSWILTRLETDPIFRDDGKSQIGKRLVSQFCSFLAEGRDGMSEAELIDLIQPGDSEGNIAALLRLLRPYLMLRGELLDFFHSQFQESVQKKYFQDQNQEIQAHEKIADYFRSLCDPEENQGWNGTAGRPFHELPYHLLKSKCYRELFALAHDQKFLNQQAILFPEEPDLPLETIQTAIRAAAEIDDAPQMADLLLTHARYVSETEAENPLQALRGGNLERAWQLAGMEKGEKFVLWTLLFAWEMYEAGLPDLGQDAINRLLDRELPPLGGWQRDVASFLFNKIPHAKRELLEVEEQLLFQRNEVGFCNRLAETGHVADAISRMRSIPNPHDRIRAILEIAKAQTARNQTEEATKTLLEIYQVLPELQVKTDSVRALQDLARELCTAGNYSAALEAAHRIEDTGYRSQTLYWISEMATKFGKFEHAATAANEISSSSLQSSAFEKIAVAQAEHQSFTEAIETLSRIVYSFDQATALRLIAVAQLNAGMRTDAVGNLREALQKASEADGATRIRLTCEIASALTDCNEFGEALKAFCSVFSSACVIGSDWSTTSGQDAKKALMHIHKKLLNYPDTDVALAGILKEKWPNLKSKIVDLIRVCKSSDNTEGALQIARNLPDKEEAELLMKELLAQPDAIPEYAGAETDEYEYESEEQDEAETERDQIRALENSIQHHLESGNFKEAAVEAAKHPYKKEEMLLQLALAEDNAGLGEHPRDTLAKILHMRKTKPYLGSYVNAQVITGEYQEAMTMLHQMQNPTREIIFQYILELFQATGKYEEALQFLQCTERPEFFALSQADIAGVYARTGNFEAALKIAEKIKDSARQSAALADIGVQHAAKGDFQSAMALVAKIEDHRRKAISLADIAIEWAHKGGDREQLTKILDIAVEETDRVEYESDRSFAFVMIAEAQAQSGLFDAAQMSLKKASYNADQIYFGKSSRLRAELHIASAFAKIGDVSTAQVRFDQYLAEARALEEVKDQIKAFLELIHVQIKLGNPETANNLLTETLPLAEASDSADLLVELANICMQMNEPQKARSILLKALDFRRLASTGMERDLLIAAILAKIGFGDDAVTAAKYVVAERPRKVMTIALALAEIGDRRNFKRLVAECGYDMDSAMSTSGMLAKMYPERAREIGRLLTEHRPVAAY